LSKIDYEISNYSRLKRNTTLHYTAIHTTTKEMGYGSYDDYGDFGLINYKGGGGNKHKSAKDKKNPDGKYTSKHVRLAQDKKERSTKKRVNQVNTKDQ
jgi:hypothetical protein